MRTHNLRLAMTGWLVRPLTLGWIMLLAFALQPCPEVSNAQSFDSGSNGRDGALNLTTPGVIEFDPVVRGLDTDGDRIYHFTTITIAAGVTVRLTTRKLNGPVFWLASGAVQIDGTVDLNGEDGQDLTSAGIPIPAVPGAGGFAGGVKRQPGFGPFGGSGPQGGSTSCFANPLGGGGPENRFLVPLLGGSGGGGGNDPAAGGGSGAGALLIASSVSMTVTGTIMANGGDGFARCAGGGGGGGGIRLVAPLIAGTGILQAQGGGQNRNQGSNCHPCGAGGGRDGVIRLEAFQHTFTGTTDPGRIAASPFALFLPVTPPSSLRVVNVAGIPVASDPTGSFTMPDVTMNSAPDVPVLIEARNIPLEAQVKLHLFSENGADQTLISPPLAGMLALSTATVSVVFPSGFSRGFVRATWTP